MSRLLSLRYLARLFVNTWRTRERIARQLEVDSERAAATARVRDRLAGLPTAAIARALRP